MRSIGEYLDSNYQSPSNSEIKHELRFRQLKEIDRRCSITLNIKREKTFVNTKKPSPLGLTNQQFHSSNTFHLEGQSNNTPNRSSSRGAKESLSVSGSSYGGDDRVSSGIDPLYAVKPEGHILQTNLNHTKNRRVQIMVNAEREVRTQARLKEPSSAALIGIRPPLGSKPMMMKNHLRQRECQQSARQNMPKLNPKYQRSNNSTDGSCFESDSLESLDSPTCKRILKMHNIKQQKISIFQRKMIDKEKVLTKNRESAGVNKVSASL